MICTHRIQILNVRCCPGKSDQANRDRSRLCVRADYHALSRNVLTVPLYTNQEASQTPIVRIQKLAVRLVAGCAGFQSRPQIFQNPQIMQRRVGRAETIAMRCQFKFADPCPRICVMQAVNSLPSLWPR